MSSRSINATRSGAAAGSGTSSAASAHGRAFGVLTAKELAFLRRLLDDYADQGGWAPCRLNPPGPGIQNLVDRGYCRLSAGRTGPLGFATGGVMVGLTEAGKVVLQCHADAAGGPPAVGENTFKGARQA